MKNILSFTKILLALFISFALTSCIYDKQFDEVEANSGQQCMDLTATKTLAELKAMTQNVTFDTDDVVEGYVASSDQTGNIYKYIYIQDQPENPTQGLIVSVDAVSTYMNYPQGAKVYIKLKGLALGRYGNFVQLGAMVNSAFSRIPEKEVTTHIYRSCTTSATIVPKVMTLGELGTANDQYVGTLIQINNAEFAARYLCMQYAPEGTSADRQLTDPTSSATTRVARNSGYASFANKTLPSGKGTFVGILSKYNSTYQFYIVRDSDLDMNTFPRNDGITAAPCSADASATSKTVAQVKALYNNALTQINENSTLTAKVIGNDETGNLYKYLYVEDETGGIRINVNMTDMYLDRRFQVGRMLTINLNGLYINSINGEMQLGGLYNSNVGQIETADIYKHLFNAGSALSTVVPTEKTISTLTTGDVGRFIKIKDLQFIDADLGKFYADGTSTTNRTLQDCSGNTLILRTSGYADFGSGNNTLLPSSVPANSTEIDTGKGDVYGILSVYNGTYQLWILNLRGADLDNTRCDGTLPPKSEVIFNDPFSNMSNWTAVSVTGSQVWTTTTFGNPGPGVIMDGARQANEDWLISKSISLVGYSDVFFSFDTDGRYSGNTLEAYVTENYTGNPSTTTWTKLDAAVDTNLNAWGPFVSSGKLSLNSFLNKSVVVAFKYTSVAGSSTTWELDNALIKGTK